LTWGLIPFHYTIKNKNQKTKIKNQKSKIKNQNQKSKFQNQNENWDRAEASICPTISSLLELLSLKVRKSLKIGKKIRKKRI